MNGRTSIFTIVLGAALALAGRADDFAANSTNVSFRLDTTGPAYSVGSVQEATTCPVTWRRGETVTVVAPNGAETTCVSNAAEDGHAEVSLGRGGLWRLFNSKSGTAMVGVPWHVFGDGGMLAASGAFSWLLDTAMEGGSRRIWRRKTMPVAYSGDGWAGVDPSAASTLTYVSPSGAEFVETLAGLGNLVFDSTAKGTWTMKLSCGTATFLASVIVSQLPSFMVTYGAPARESWSVEVEGQPVVLKRQATITHPNDGGEPYVDELKGGWYQYGRFTLQKPVEVRVRSTRSLTSLRIVPEKYGVKPRRISDREVAVSIVRPCHLSFESNGRKGALHLFADASATPPSPGQEVIYYGPGEHMLNPAELTLHSGQTLYLDEGAVIHGRVAACGENIEIIGPGTINGSRFERFKGPSGGSFFWIHNATNVTVRGVTLTAPNKWTVMVRESDRVLFDEVRVLSSNMINDDGIDIVNSRNVTIQHSFIRTQDDNICTKGISYPMNPEDSPPVENVHVEDCELWCDSANTFRLGYECDTPYMKGVTVRNVDVLHFSPHPPIPVSYTWSHAIFKIQTADGVEFSGLDVKGVRINAEGNDINLVIAEPKPTAVPRESWSNKYQYTRGGSIRNCRFEDISVVGKKEGFVGGIHLLGRTAEESVSDMHFSNIRYFGEPVTGTSDCVNIGSYASGVFE